MIRKATSKTKPAAKSTMARRHSNKPKATKATDYFIGEKMEGGTIIGISSAAGRYWFMVKEGDKITILHMASNCKTYPMVARNIPQKNMDELFYCFKMFMEEKK
jgi:hypothetical protein